MTYTVSGGALNSTQTNQAQSEVYFWPHEQISNM